MATAYEYNGPDERDYPGWGMRVAPGDVVRLDGRPPQDGCWREVDEEPNVEAQTEPPAAPEGEEEPPAPKQPNLAASAADWNEYALAMGVPEDVVAANTRRAIVAHFTGGDPLPGVEQPAPTPDTPQTPETPEGGRGGEQTETGGGTPPQHEGE